MGLSHEQTKKKQAHNGNEKQRKRKKNSEQINAQQHGDDTSSQDAFRNRLGSKETDHLFLEHMHPMNYRDSFTRNEITNEWMDKKKDEREKTKRVKKKKKSQNHHMQTVTEEEPSTIMLNQQQHQKFKPSQPILL